MCHFLEGTQSNRVNTVGNGECLYALATHESAITDTLEIDRQFDGLQRTATGKGEGVDHHRGTGQLELLQLAAVVKETAPEHVIVRSEVDAIERDIRLIGTDNESLTEVELCEYSFRGGGDILHATQFTDEHHVLAVDKAINFQPHRRGHGIGCNQEQLLFQCSRREDRQFYIFLCNSREGEQRKEKHQ